MCTRVLLISITGVIVSFLEGIYVATQDISQTTNHPQKEELDWNLYELNKKQVLEYENIEQHKDDIIKEIDSLEKKAKAEADLEDKFEYLYHDILKRDSYDNQMIENEHDTNSHVRKRSMIESISTINGGWSPWSNVATPCNATCGGGKMMRRRSCTNPIPQVLLL